MWRSGCHYMWQTKVKTWVGGFEVTCQWDQIHSDFYAHLGRLPWRWRWRWIAQRYFFFCICIRIVILALQN